MSLDWLKKIEEPQSIRNLKGLEMDWKAWKEEYLVFEMETLGRMEVLLEDKTVGGIDVLLLERDIAP